MKTDSNHARGGFIAQSQLYLFGNFRPHNDREHCIPLPGGLPVRVFSPGGYEPDVDSINQAVNQVGK